MNELFITCNSSRLTRDLTPQFHILPIIISTAPSHLRILFGLSKAQVALFLGYKLNLKGVPNLSACAIFATRRYMLSLLEDD